MARPKSPQKLLEEALAKGDLEAIKAAYAKTKEKPKKKPAPKVSKAKIVKNIKPKKTKILEKEYDTDENGAVLLVKESRTNNLEEFRVKRREDSDDNDVEQSVPRRLKTGIQINKFRPDPNIGADLIKEDKKAMKKWSPKSKEYRDKVDISEKKVTCENEDCDNVYSMEKWEYNAKKSVEGMQFICPRCIRKNKG